MRRPRISAVTAVLVIAVALAAALPAQSRAQISPTTQELQREKLQQEVRQLRLENESKTGLRGTVNAYGSIAGFVTGLAALIAVVLTYRAQKQEEGRQHALNREQRDKDRAEEERQKRRDLDLRFTQILADLGAGNDAIQAAASVSLLTFLRDDLDDYHHQVRLVTLANLKVEHGDAVVKLLVRVLERALRTAAPLDPIERDFSRALLRQADLSRLDLREADLGFALMRGVDLTDTNLWRARGFRVELESARLCGQHADLQEVRFGGSSQCANADFSDANMRAAHLEDAILTGARFQRARLQSAHFDRADLTGARFEQADLNDCYFKGAKLDGSALRSITRARNWTKAHFDTDHREQLSGLRSASASDSGQAASE